MNKQSFNEEEIANYIFDSLFNEDVYEVFPGLEECYDNNSSVMEDIFMNFYKDLCDLSKSVVRPFLDERSTFIYRKVYGILDDGALQTKVSVGSSFNLTGIRVGQIVKSCNNMIVDYFIREYKNILSNRSCDDFPIESLGLSKRIYLKLKRLGINYVSEIDIDSLKDVKYFGEHTINDIDECISRVRK